MMILWLLLIKELGYDVNLLDLNNTKKETIEINNKEITNSYYEILKTKYEDMILDKEKDDIKNIISNINEISDSLNKYTLDNSIQPFNAKPLE